MDDPTLSDRVEIARKCLDQHPGKNDKENAPTDLMVDLLHYAVAMGQDPEVILGRVRMHFEAEQAGED